MPTIDYVEIQGGIFHFSHAPHLYYSEHQNITFNTKVVMKVRYGPSVDAGMAIIWIPDGVAPQLYCDALSAALAPSWYYIISVLRCVPQTTEDAVRVSAAEAATIIFGILAERGEEILNDEGVDSAVCISIAEEIVKAIL